MVKPYTKFWKAIPTRSSRDVVTYCALKAYFAKNKNNVSKEDIFKALIEKSFTPITNKVKLRNGMTEWNAVRVAFDRMRWYKVVPIFGMPRDQIVKEIFSGSEDEYEAFNVFVKSLLRTNFKFKKRLYTYIFVDQDNVEPVYQAVQAAHVAMVIGQKMNKSFDSSSIYYQICKKPEKVDIENFSYYLTDHGFVVEKFYEPDVDRIIAMGTHPVPSHKRKLLQSYELLTF